MINWFLKFIGYKLIYSCTWGEYTSRYNTVDFMMARPIHPDMSIAPPWAKLKIVKTNK